MTRFLTSRLVRYGVAAALILAAAAFAGCGTWFVLGGHYAGVLGVTGALALQGMAYTVAGLRDDCQDE